MLKLLLIDDDEELCAELKELLETEGFEVQVAFDGLKALDHVETGSYNIVILDLKLPGLNGYDVLRKIRSSDRPVKVMVVSGRPLGEALLKEKGVTQDEEEKILSLADVVINKPFMIDHFVHKVKQLSAAIGG